jgi:hypothetical protein
MTITEIKQFPIRVKLNDKFQLEESFDVGTILQLNSAIIDSYDDGWNCYRVEVTALGSDLEHNKSICERNWMNFKPNNFELDIFEFHKDDMKPNGDFNTSIFVMGDDDCFDLVDELKVPKYTTADILLIVSEIAPMLNPHITETNVAQFVDGLKRKDQLKRK